MKRPFLSSLAASALIAGCCSPSAPEAARVEAEPVPYQSPFASPGTKFASLPPPVQHSIRAQAGAAEILDIARFTETGDTVYKVWFRKDSILPPLYLNQDGSVLDPVDRMVAMGAPAESYWTGTGAGGSSLNIADLLPETVITALRARAPLTEVAHISKQPWGGATIYEINFKDPQKYPALYINSAGTVVEMPPK